MGSNKPAPPPVDELAERAERVRAMLARWRTEDVSAEPEWNVDDLQPMHLDPTPILPKDR